MSAVFLLLRNLLLTVLIEGVLMLVFVKKRETLYHSVLVNMLTNPALNLCLILWSTFVLLPTDPYYYIITAVLEIAAVVTEWILYYKMGDFGIKKAFFASFLLNAASYSFGLLIG
jgi:ABC-type multidrug transport system permease subunit